MADTGSQGYCRALLTTIERLLGVLSVGRLVLPTSEDTELIWINKFGFSRMTDEQVSTYLIYRVHFFLTAEAVLILKWRTYARYVGSIVAAVDDLHNNTPNEIYWDLYAWEANNPNDCLECTDLSIMATAKSQMKYILVKWTRFCSGVGITFTPHFGTIAWVHFGRFYWSRERRSRSGKFSSNNIMDPYTQFWNMCLDTFQKLAGPHSVTACAKTVP